jgi:class 3 adenylate cyclase/tetratricopeptide (TPR) repeat protein
MMEHAQLEQAIAALEGQRAILGDAVVDAALEPLREKLASLKAGDLSTGQQRKQVTVLFCDLVGFTPLAERMDPEDVREILDCYFKPWNKAIAAWGGRVEKFIGDAVMAVFGIPVAGENDPENAIRAALAVRDGLGPFNDELHARYGVRLSMRVGIHTGPVVVGEMGRAGDFTVTGDTVNLASRLESNAPPGEILISHDTYHQVRGVFDVQSQGPLTVKGRTEAVQTYIVQQAKPRAFRMGTRGIEGIETRMIGRDSELLALESSFADAMEGGETRLVLVVGEAGIGKSRLLYEFENWIELRPELIYFFKGRAAPSLQGVPYGIVRDMFAYRFEIRESDSAAAALEKFRAGMAEGLPPERADLVGHLVGFDFSASPAVQNLIGSPDFGTLAQAYLTHYVLALAKDQPMIILLEDLHWADDSSLDLIDHLVKAIPRARLLVVGLARPALFERRPHWGEGESAFTGLELKPLSRRTSRALVDEILQKVEAIPEALRNLIVEGSEGNPFYVEELVKMLIDEGVIERGSGLEGLWRVNQEKMQQARIPPTLTGILQARLDSLPRTERELLQRASVVGRLFWDEAVAELADEKRETLAPALEAIRGRELIYRRDRSTFAGTEEYLFRHALLRDVAYETVLLKLRRYYHTQTAHWLEAHAGERISEYVGVIADHLEHAGQVEEAVSYLRKAGKKLLEAGGFREALGFARRALALVPAECEEQAELRVQAGEALVNLGENAEARSELEAALPLAQKARNEGLCATVLEHLGIIAREQGEWPLARTHFEESLALALKTGDFARSAHILLSLGWVDVMQGEYPAAGARLCESQELYEKQGDRLGLARVYNALGVLAERKQEYAESRELRLKSLAFCREIGARRDEAIALANLGENSRLQGNYTLARDYYQEALEIDREVGDKVNMTVNIDNLGHTASALGDYPAARASYHEALRIATDTGFIPLVLDSLAGLAGVFARTAQPKRALELLGVVSQHPSLLSDTGPVIEQALADLRTQLPPEAIAAGLAHAQELKLDTIVAEILAQDAEH